MRVNVDSSVLSDPRFKLVAKDLDVTLREVLGASLLLWFACYDRRSERLSLDEANASVDLNHFAEALIRRELAHADGENMVVIHGVSERIRFLERQKERGKAGGRSSGKARHNSNVGREANASNTAKRTLDARRSVGLVRSEAYSLDLDLALDLDRSETAAHAAPLQLVNPKPKKPERRAKSSMPQGWAPNAGHAEKARATGVDLGVQVEKFRDYHAAKGSVFADWDAAFRTWLGNAVDFARSGGVAQPLGPRPPKLEVRR